MTKKLLVVDDKKELRTLLKQYLAQEGFDVLTAGDGREALFIARQEKPDLIILDLMMPLASGDAVLGYIRSTTELRDTKVLVVSAHPNAERVSVQLGADGFLAKPVDMHTFIAKVNGLIAQEA